MVLFANDGVLHATAGNHIDHRFVELGNTIGSDHIVLTQCQARWPRRGWAQATGVFEGEEFHELCLGWLLQEDLPEVDHCVGVGGLDDVPGEVCFGLGEDGEGVNHGDVWRFGV